ncbi:FGGY-family carbohydrate kinase [uncultured Cohaesibacter sp.]|uniref:FGGY-family carbohydrate kinase n=1 Tax=uncultured Cohaesibacter sp. TaxID=1002546 RepID=UPI003748FDC4
MATSIPIGAEGVVYLPYLSESGIIAPVVDANARAQFAGLSPNSHPRPHGPRPSFEGVAFALADLVDLLGFDGDEIRLTGGGGQSLFWSQMITDRDRQKGHDSLRVRVRRQGGRPYSRHPRWVILPRCAMPPSPKMAKTDITSRTPRPTRPISRRANTSAKCGKSCFRAEFGTIRIGWT